VSRPVFRFGLFEADPTRGVLTRDGARVKIQDQPFRVLVFLLERSGEIVMRDELRHELWPEGTYVDFDGSLNVILKKLRAAIDDDSDNPRFVETIPRRGYRFIAPVSVANGVSSAAVENASTFRTAPDGVESSAPQAPQESQNGRTTTVPSRSRLALVRYSVFTLLVLALVVSGSLALYRKAISPSIAKRSTVPANSISVRESVAVLGFHNVSGRADDAWLGTALSEMLRTELAGGEKLRLVSGEDVANLRLTAPWPQTDTFDAKTTARIGSALSSDLLVLGSYTVIGGSDRRRLRVDARLQDVRTGEILSQVAENGGSEDLFQIVSRVGAALRDRLGIPALAATDEAGVLASVPVDPDAARFYALGLAKLRDFDASAAKDLLAQATEAEPKFSLAHAMLARAYSQLGYEQKRKEETKKAWDLSGGLPRAERMLVEGDYYESLANHEKAISTYHALFELFPDNVDYGLQLASVQILAGQASEARETLQRLRQLPAPASNDPRIDLTESRAIPDNKPAELSLLRDAMTKAAAQGKKLILAQARKQECMTLAYTDQLDRATAPCQDAFNAFFSAGNRLAAADSLRLMADIEGTKGRYQQAFVTYQRAFGILQELGEHEKTGAVLNNMAIIFENEGKLDRAEQFYRQAKSHFDQAGDRLNSSTALGNIADVLYLRGNLRAAEKTYQQTIDTRASLESADTSYALYRLADLELTEGRVEDARRGAEQAIKVMRPEQGSYQYLTGAMIVLGEALQAAGDLSGARQEFQRALDIRRKSGEVEGAAESETELAALALDQSQPKQAEALLRAAIPKFEAEKIDPDSIAAYTLLSRALLAQGKTEGAHLAIDRAEQLSTDTNDPALRLSLAIQKARVDAANAKGDASGKVALKKAQEQLGTVVETASKLGYYQIECQARLALGQVELQWNPTFGHAQLVALARDTQGRGLELLARQAERAMSIPTSSYDKK
jgi:eukaryotic-like serine/threonine-protein kinase